MKTIRRLIVNFMARLRQQEPAPFKVAYTTGAICACGETSAIIDGRCWYCRSGNKPVKEPMTWSPDD